MIKKTIKWLIICSWALLLAQFPEFIEQYVDHLSGHLQELRSQEKVIKQMMGEEDLSLLAIKMKESGESYAQKQAGYLTYFVDRKDSFERGYTSLTQASFWSLPFYFLRYFNSEVISETVDTFNFGLPLTYNGVLYAVLGGLLGFFNWVGLVRLFRKDPEPEEIGI